jgi:chaperonin cofactor prefoldin
MDKTKLESSDNARNTQITGNGATVYMNSGNDYYKGKVIKQIDVIKSQRAVIERLQHQIDRMQDQMEVYQKQFTKAQELKEKLMDMLLDDREMLRGKVFGDKNGK